MKIILKILCLLFIIMALPAGLSSMQKKNPLHFLWPRSIITKTLGALTALGGLIYWFTPDRSMPTIDKLNVVTFIPTDNINTCEYMHQDTSKEDVLKILKNKKGSITIRGNVYNIQSGIPSCINQFTDPIFIYSGGYSNEGNPYAFCVYTAMKAGIITGPAIVFDYATDTRRAFNFGQKQDLHCIDLVYQNLVKQHPAAKVVLYGACKGATNKLRFVAEKSNKGQSIQNIKGIIAESPPLSVRHALQNTHGGSFTPFMCRLIMPNYNPRKKTIMNTQNFTNIPVLIGSLPHDTISALPDVKNMVNHLQAKGAGHIDHFICDTSEAHIQHGKIGQSKGWQQKVNSFLSRLF